MPGADPAELSHLVIGRRAAPAPNPSVNFLAASCVSEDFCAVVGQYSDSTGSLSGIIDLLSDGAWQSYAAPEPANNPSGGGPGDNASGDAYSGLNAVSCPVVGALCLRSLARRQARASRWVPTKTPWASRQA